MREKNENMRLCGTDAFIIFASLFVTVLIAVGCGHSSGQQDGGFVPITNGFGFGQHSRETSPGHRAIWADFEYRSTNGQTAVVWPYLHAIESLHMYNGKAVFLGDKPSHYRDGAEGLVARVIAFEAPVALLWTLRFKS